MHQHMSFLFFSFVVLKFSILCVYFVSGDRCGFHAAVWLGTLSESEVCGVISINIVVIYRMFQQSQ